MLENPNPLIYEIINIKRNENNIDNDENIKDEIDSLEIFDHIRNINDPEHPHTLEQLKVTQLEGIKVNDKENKIHIYFTPTIPHCSMATLSKKYHFL